MNSPATTGLDPNQQKFETIISREVFTGLKAILESLSPNRDALSAAVRDTNSYEELLGRLGYRLVFRKQIHVQDCYSRVGRDGGIRAVLPYHDVPTQSSLPTLVNLDSTVTTTLKSVTFFNDLLVRLKAQLNDQEIFN
jgi:hypothetical protein